MRYATCVLLAFWGSIASANIPGSRNLTFEERVNAQAAIESVYYRHQLGAKLPFRDAVPRAVLEAKVRNVLRQSAALASRFHTAVTDEMLERELARIAQGSRMPERLLELYAALDNDPFLVKECLARATLVDRLTHDFYESDRARRTGPGAAWDEWWDDVAPTLDSELVSAVAERGGTLPLPAAGRASDGPACTANDTWDNGILDDMPEPRTGHSAVWTGSLMVVWGGRTNNNSGGYGLDTGGRYDPATNTWAATTLVGAPLRRSEHVAVWTGTRMVIWGGLSPDGYQATGGVYDPVGDTWTATTTANAPSSRTLHTGLWTGAELIVWGGEGPGGVRPVDGGRYNPASDTWTATSLTGAPAGRLWPTGVWTGTEMIVWGGGFFNGSSFSYVDTGGRYNPATDTWTTTSLVNAPSARALHSAVWTGDRMIVWGGSNGTGAFGTGGRYDPVSDTWAATSTSSAAAARRSHAAVWTGSVMIVWGGLGANSEIYNAGGRYDPVADTWLPTQLFNAVEPRHSLTAVWTGATMMVWGGQGYGSFRLDNGGRYDPVTNVWTAIASSPPIAPRHKHTAIWTGSQMIVWGGQDASDAGLGTGARYDPATDSWSVMTNTSAPPQRYSHTAVWTGSVMIVWGGRDTSALNTGGRYNPLTNTWAATSIVSAPTARAGHSAVWTGDSMVVWGGSAVTNSGGKYDPVSDTWTSTSTVNAPSTRSGQSGVWTGSRVVIWGGALNGIAQNTGGLYDPSADTWVATSTTNAPQARSGHTVVWTGSSMIVWGGVNSGLQLNTGGRYDPTSDTWTATSTMSAPSPRYGHTATWTGDVMVVWGGGTLDNSGRSGARYDPTANTWAPTTFVDVPSERWEHTAVWADATMIVWGGYTDSTTAVRSGGRYVLAPFVDDDVDGYSVCGGDCNDGSASVHPGALETCNGLDDDCDQLTDNGIAAPSGVATLIEAKSGDTAQISWSAVPSATSYDVVSGSLDTLRSGAGDFTASTTTCLGGFALPTTVDDAAVPGPGEGVWHLVRAVNACGGNGSYDDGVPSQPQGRDAGVNASIGACP